MRKIKASPLLILMFDNQTKTVFFNIINCFFPVFNQITIIIYLNPQKHESGKIFDIFFVKISTLGLEITKIITLLFEKNKNIKCYKNTF